MSTAATAGNDFATRLYAELAGTRPNEDLFLSPFSIQVALAMCAAGARGRTRAVMADLLGAPRGVEEQNRQYARLLKSVRGEGERPFELYTANALWGQRGFHFRPDFKKAVAEFYGGAFHEVDFAVRPGEAVETINAWVSEQTREKIKDLIGEDDIDELTQLILTNAIYFKGRWEQQFDKANTRDEAWYGRNGTGKVPLMHQTGTYLYSEGGGFQALDLPYRGGQLSMLVVLPREEAGIMARLLGRKKDGLTDLESRWAAEDTYRQVTASLHDVKVIVSLPRFTMETAFRLKPVLCALGAKLAFRDDADFGGIGE